MPEPTLNLPLVLSGDDARLDDLVNGRGMCQREASRLLWGPAVTGPLRPMPRVVAAPIPALEVSPMKKRALLLGLSVAAWSAIAAGALVYAERKAAQAAGWLL